MIVSTVVLSIFIGILIGIFIDKLSKYLMEKNPIETPKFKTLNQDVVDMYFSETSHQIIAASIKMCNYVDPSLDRKTRIKSVAILVQDELMDQVPEEDFEIINQIDECTFIKYICNIIDSNYNEIFSKIKDETTDIEEPVIDQKIKIKKPNTTETDISSTLMNFYSEGFDI